MQAVGNKDTDIEWKVRRLGFSLGYRYRLHRKNLTGTFDLVFPSRKKVISVHEHFWHAHDCSYGRTPKSRRDYWLPKLERNKQRDAENLAKLEAPNWGALIVWQCEFRKLGTLTVKNSSFPRWDIGIYRNLYAAIKT